MRLDKFVSNNSGISRKNITIAIRNKKVSVNKIIITDPSFKVNPHIDIIEFNGCKIKFEEFVYFALFKPKGFICSNDDDYGTSVLNLIKETNKMDLHIVGRLDKDTTGLVILTNDGQFTHNVKNPKNNIEKEYEVTLENVFTNEMNEKLKQEIIMDGKKIKPFILKKINGKKLNIILTEGKYHQVKRIFKIANNKVNELKRIRIGNLKLYDLKLKEGEYIKINSSWIF